MNENSKIRFYNEDDGDVSILAEKTICIVGYGNLGRPLALNLRDSGVGSVIVGNIRDQSWDKAQEDGFPVFPISEACSLADIILVLVPDEVQPQVYKDEIATNISQGSAIVFASGYSLAYNLIQPDKSLDVLLLAPRMLGGGIRSRYLRGEGFPGFVSVEQDGSKHAWPILMALAKATGALRVGVMELSATKEAHLDLFIEQGLGPLIGAGVLASFQVGVEAGFPPEALVLEMYMSGEMSHTFQTMATMGFLNQVNVHGFAAAFGGMIRSVELDREPIEQNMQQVLEEIRNGSFAQQLQAEMEEGYPSLPFLEEMLQDDDPITNAEQKVRQQMKLTY